MRWILFVWGVACAMVCGSGILMMGCWLGVGMRGAMIPSLTPECLMFADIQFALTLTAALSHIVPKLYVTEL